MQTLHNNAHIHGGGGNNLSLNTQSLDSSPAILESIHSSLRAALAAWQSSLPTKLTFSISLVLAAALGLAAQGFDESVMNECNNNQFGMAADRRKICLNGHGELPGNTHTPFYNVYMWSNPGVRKAAYTLRNASLDPVIMMFRHNGWTNIKLNNTQYGSITIKNGGTSDAPKGQIEFSIEGGSGNSISDITHEALRLNLKGGASQVLTVTTLNQLTNANGLSQIFKNVNVEHFNLYAGKSYQRGGKVETLNLLGGEYHLGATDSTAVAEEAGTIGNLVLADGTFKQYKGEIGSITLTSDKKQASFTTKNTFTSGNEQPSYNGLITKIDKQVSGAHTIELGDNKANGTITATLTNGSLTLDNTTGDITNNGELASLEVSKKSNGTRGSEGIVISNAATASIGTLSTATKSTTINNAGTIDKLELKESSKVTNTGIIKSLDVQNGDSTINTLNGVGQGTAGNVEPHTLSNINITKDAKLTVDTLSVGLKGNQAIERVTINNDTSTQGTNKEFAVNKIQVTYLDGNFDPAKSISKNLTDYVTSGSHSYVDGASKPTFESSPELQGIGVKFNPDGTPIFEVEASVAASMTSVVVRQSMRRKMLIDTYLAEQNRRSLKNKERRTKQRIEAATLGDARAQYQKDLAKYKLDLAKWDKLASTKENKALIAKYEQEDKAYQKALEQYNKDKKAYEDNRKNLETIAKAKKLKAPIEPKAPVRPNLKPSDKHYKKAMADFTKAQKAYEKAMSNYEQELRIYNEENSKLETIARANNLKAPIAPKAPIRPNLKPNHKDYKRVMAAYESNQRAYQTALKRYELEKKSYEEKRKNLEVLAKTNKFNANLKAPIEPKAPVRPNLKPNHKDYRKAMSKYEQERKDYLKDFKQYEQDKKSYEREYQKLIALADAQSNKLKAPIQPKAPTKPKILASKPEMPQEPKLGEISAELLAKHKVQGDFFIRAYGGTGSHKATNGAQTSSWSVGTLFGSTWDLALGQTSGNIGFYGGYEYIYNGYKQAHIDAQGHTGFLGLRFSHIFAKTKLAGFYYLADINGGYSDISVGQDMNGMRFSANVGNINFGSSFRLGSSVYMYGAKSILFPSVGVGVEGGYLGEFEMRTNRSGELRYGGLSQGYAVTYAQANLNYYQEYGKRLSTTLGGGFRYLMNTDINIMPTLNGKAYTIDEKTGRAAAVHVAPFFYQGTFVINYHTDKLGNFSAGYVAVGGELGITHNASVRWHYFF
ncbi:hypothetical protein [Helicobacter canis]|uniref:Autotransporter domain-containing protein n=1 Tax=Helicobacter canis TaxID=29419 RepID=A0A377J5R1_9HELI|nr:hypothetical protein [Helicobacter canis]STO97659.1 Uncharacterised protein [Helicobacter canis]